MRAPRFPLRLAVRYRRIGDHEWRRGETENISRSGVLIRSDDPPELDATVELLVALDVRKSGADTGKCSAPGAWSATFRPPTIAPARDRPSRSSSSISCRRTRIRSRPRCAEARRIQRARCRHRADKSHRTQISRRGRARSRRLVPASDARPAHVSSLHTISARRLRRASRIRDRAVSGPVIAPRLPRQSLRISRGISVAPSGRAPHVRFHGGSPRTVEDAGLFLVAILTIAVGIGANTALFSVYDRLVLNPVTIPTLRRSSRSGRTTRS